MSRHGRARLVCAALLVVTFTAPAHAEPFTLDAALARARERAPAALVALARIEEARAGRVGAAVRFTQNAELQLGAGMRFGEPRTVALQGQLSQPLELARRGARIRVADAAIAHAEALTAATLRELSFAVAAAFFEARFHDFAVELAERHQAVAGRAAEAAVRRRQAGDLTDLDVNLAAIALGRARSAVAAAQAARAEAIGTLGALVGAAPGEALALAGALSVDVLGGGAAGAIAERADLRALAAEVGVARAEQGLAQANGRPDLGVWIGYQSDEDDPIVLGGISVTLPVWNRAQGERALARAKQRRAEIEQGALVAQAARQASDEQAVLGHAREAVAVFERDVLPTLADSERLLERSIETGQIAVSEYLVARQEILSGRREYLERQLALVRAAIDARFAAGGAL